MGERAAQTTQDTLEIAGAAVGAGIAAYGAATSDLVASLLAAAGASAAVPAVGWVVAGGAVLAAGVVAIVGCIRSGQVKRAEAVALAVALGVDEDLAEEIPGFVTDALEWPAEKRAKKAEKYAKQLGRKLRSEKVTRSERRDQARLGVLAALDLAELAQERGTIPASNVSASEARAAFRPASIGRRPQPGGGSAVPLVIGGLLLGTAALAAAAAGVAYALRKG
jgi:hypothetical protein